MSQQIYYQAWSLYQACWVTEEASNVGMQLDGAFRRFAEVVNATAANAHYPLSVVASHADAADKTSNVYGYTWQLGHPVNPVHTGIRTYSPAGFSDSYHTYANVRVYSALAAEHDPDPGLNNGYGAYGTTLYQVEAALDFLGERGSTRDYATPQVLLVVFQDTTAGSEYFGYVFKGDLDEYGTPQDTGALIYRTPEGWCSWFYFPWIPISTITSKEKPGTAAQMALGGHRYLGDDPFPHVHTPDEPRLHHQQLQSPVLLGPGPGVVSEPHYSPTGSVPAGGRQSRFPLSQLPAVLYGGNLNTMPGTWEVPRARNFCRVKVSGGTFYQLGCRPIDNDTAGGLDLWIWCPDGMVVDQPAPWKSYASRINSQFYTQTTDFNVLHHDPAVQEAIPFSPYGDGIEEVDGLALLAMPGHGLVTLRPQVVDTNPRPQAGLLYPRRRRR